MIYVAPDYLEVAAMGKTLLCAKMPDFQKKKKLPLQLSRPLLKTRLKYSNNLNHKSNGALGK